VLVDYNYFIKKGLKVCKANENILKSICSISFGGFLDDAITELFVLHCLTYFIIDYASGCNVL